MEQSNADFICLQEVLLEFIVLLQQESEYLSRMYTISSTSRWKAHYGVVILAKRELRPSFRYYDLPTGFGRTLVVAEVNTEVSSTKIAVRVATAHFESLANHFLRQKQLQIAAEVLGLPHEEAKSVEAILCGDFNFCSFRNFSGRGELENRCLGRILPAFTDLWPAIKPVQDRGYTFDSSRNRNIGKHEQSRYDRVLANLQHLKAVQIDLLGTDPISTEAEEDGQKGQSDDESLPPTPPRPCKKQALAITQEEEEDDQQYQQYQLAQRVGTPNGNFTTAVASSSASAGTSLHSTPPPAAGGCSRTTRMSTPNSAGGCHMPSVSTPNSTGGSFCRSTAAVCAENTTPQGKVPYTFMTTPLQTSELCPSDHFGLRAVFTLA
jgi:endonuclease/exonuclease/phosphatase family metal-dependent hydrolase